MKNPTVMHIRAEMWKQMREQVATLTAERDRLAAQIVRLREIAHDQTDKELGAREEQINALALLGIVVTKDEHIQRARDVAEETHHEIDEAAPEPRDVRDVLQIMLVGYELTGLRQGGTLGYCCTYCHRDALSLTDFRHADNCPIAVARAILEERDGVPIVSAAAEFALTDSVDEIDKRLALELTEDKAREAVIIASRSLLQHIGRTVLPSVNALMARRRLCEALSALDDARAAMKEG